MAKMKADEVKNKTDRRICDIDHTPGRPDRAGCLWIWKLSDQSD